MMARMKISPDAGETMPRLPRPVQLPLRGVAR